MSKRRKLPKVKIMNPYSQSDLAEAFIYRLFHLEYAENRLRGLTYFPIAPWEPEEGLLKLDEEFIKRRLKPEHELHWVAIIHATLHLKNSTILGDEAIQWAKESWKKFRLERCRKVELSRIESWRGKAFITHSHLFKSMTEEKDLRNAYRLYMDDVFKKIKNHLTTL